MDPLLFPWLIGRGGGRYPPREEHDQGDEDVGVVETVGDSAQQSKSGVEAYWSSPGFVDTSAVGEDIGARWR